MNFKSKKVLVTGAGGFIGSHLCERLSMAGADVTALIRYNSRGMNGHLEQASPEAKKAIRVIFGDVRDESVFHIALKNCEIVFHLAAVPGIPYSFIHPRDVFEINALGSLNLLNAARSMTPERIILASSSETYGNSDYLPIDEDHPLRPRSPYAASKVAMEKLAQSFMFAYELPVTIVRLFNTFGPRQSARAVTPTIISQLLKGNEVRVGTLAPKRDFTLVLDTVEAFLKIAGCEKDGEVFNIGNGYSISIKEIIDTACRVLGKRDVVVHTDEQRIRPGASEVWDLVADVSHLKQATGWLPRFTYEQGLELTIRWISDNIGTYKTDIYSV